MLGSKLKGDKHQPSCLLHMGLAATALHGWRCKNRQPYCLAKVRVRRAFRSFDDSKMIPFHPCPCNEYMSDVRSKSGSIIRWNGGTNVFPPQNGAKADHPRTWRGQRVDDVAASLIIREMKAKLVRCQSLAFLLLFSYISNAIGLRLTESYISGTIAY